MIDQSQQIETMIDELATDALDCVSGGVGCVIEPNG